MSQYDDIDQMVTEVKSNPRRGVLILVIILVLFIGGAFLAGLFGEVGKSLIEKQDKAASSKTADRGSDVSPREGPASNTAASSAEPVRSAATRADAAVIKPCSGVTVIDSAKRVGIARQMVGALPSSTFNDIDPPIQTVQWTEQAEDIGAKFRCVVVMHLHSLQPDYTKERDKGVLSSEKALIRGLRIIASRSPHTQFVIISSGFRQEQNGSGLEGRLAPAI